MSFVTDGIDSALEQAQRAAGGNDISLAGGAQTARQYLDADRADAMQINVVPILLGDGERLFDNLGFGNPRLTHAETMAGPGVTHLRFTRP